ncbi:MAG TPA: HEAT repeat domain-containing protein [Planctomycetaceae bacterium]
MRPHFVHLLLLWGAACAGPAAHVVRADYVTLKTGGEIRGEFLASGKTNAAASQLSMRMLSGATVVVQRDDVAAVVRRRPVVEEYHTLRRAAADTVAGHWELAEWCRQNSLPQQRADHLHAVLQIDVEHVLAHRALGHVRDQGRWTTRDEMLAARGYVKKKGKQLLPQELELTDQQERIQAAERTWLKKVKLWQGWLESERGQRHGAGAARLKAIRDPDAVSALVRTFRHAPEESQRLLFVEVVSAIEGDKSLAALVAQSIVDESRTVRDAALVAIRRKDPARAVPLYVRALKSPLNSVVNRAGSALGQLGDERVVPFLIEALLTRHEYRAMVRDDASQIASIETLDLVSIVGPVSGKGDPSGKSPAQESTSESAVFDADSEEFEVNIAKDQENSDVLAALTLLTSRNFGYDVPAWRNWFNSRKNAGNLKTTK